MDARGRLRSRSAPKRLALALGLLALSAMPSCKKPPPPAAQGDAGPMDHLAPGEAPEGREKAFGLTLPQSSTVRTRWGGTIGVVSALSPEQLSNFVRVRVKEGKVVSGTSSTRFENVVVPAEPKRRLTIDVRPTRLVDGLRSEMTIEDVTPPPLDPKLTEDQRWKKAGLTPDGRVLDPKNLQ